MVKVIIARYKGNNNYSLGNCFIIDANGQVWLQKKSLERGWQDNQRNISCIPIGSYKMRQDYSGRFKKMLWEIYGVKGRSECKFHAANYWKELNGCIALGYSHKDINADKDPDLTSSRRAMAAFEAALEPYKNQTLTLQII